jgi:pilus assembly protein CpaB
MKRRILLIGLAVVLALAGTFAVYAYVKNADKRATAGEQATKVVVAAKRIPAGTSWADARNKAYLHTESMPSDVVPADALQSTTADIAPDDVVAADVAAGQIVLQQMFGAKTPTTSGLHIPGDKMAVSLKVTADADVAGYVQPGSQVAIFDTFIVLGQNIPAGTKTGADKTDNWETKLTLPRVDVLAVSQAAPSGTQQGLSGSNNSSSQMATLLVTLAVPQSDAERLIHVAQTGNPYLALLTSNSHSAPSTGVDNQGKVYPVFPK